LNEHERSRRHRAALIEWKELEQHLSQNTVFDAGLQAQKSRPKDSAGEMFSTESYTL